MRDGTSDCAFSQGAIILQKLSFVHSHGKCSHEFYFLVMQEVVKVDIGESKWFTILVPPSPHPSLVLLFASLYCSLAGSFDSSDISHETTLLGSGKFWKGWESDGGQKDIELRWVCCQFYCRRKRGHPLQCFPCQGTIDCSFWCHAQWNQFQTFVLPQSSYLSVFDLCHLL